MKVTTRFPDAAKHLATIVTGALLITPLAGAAFAAQDGEIRTQAPELGGYAMETSAAPLSVLFFEQVIPIPTDPGDPQFEVTEAYTEAHLSTGPDARALGSSLWPGAAFGEGFSTICECGQDYAVKADARYPGEPHESTKEAPTGGGMHAEALGLDVLGRAESSQSPNPENVRYGQVASRSTATVRKGVATTTVDASASDLSLAAGIITIDEVRTTIEGSSDGEKAKVAGRTTVTGLVIAGTGYTVDDKGIRPVEDGKPGGGIVPLPSSLPVGDELRKALGIEVELIPHETEVNGPDAERTAGGLRITIDTAVMKSALSTLPVSVYDVIGQLPREIRTQLYPFLALAPEIVYIIGRGEVEVGARLPFVVPSPPPPPPRRRRHRPSRRPSPPAAPRRRRPRNRRSSRRRSRPPGRRPSRARTLRTVRLRRARGRSRPRRMSRARVRRRPWSLRPARRHPSCSACQSRSRSQGSRLPP